MNGGGGGRERRDRPCTVYGVAVQAMNVSSPVHHRRISAALSFQPYTRQISSSSRLDSACSTRLARASRVERFDDIEHGGAWCGAVSKLL
jgi:hypothetical protein